MPDRDVILSIQGIVADIQTKEVARDRKEVEIKRYREWWEQVYFGIPGWGWVGIGATTAVIGAIAITRRMGPA